MTRTIYALLVGIDQYQPPLNQLRGCVNDVTRMETFLSTRVKSNNTAHKLLVLKNDEATRQNVINGFRQHLSQAGKDDIILFYFSGHGSQETAPPEFWHLEPDRLNETLVCYDSRMPGQFDLADKELAKLIADVAKRKSHVLAVLDSCHSGSGTRNGATPGIRHVPTDERKRLITDYIVTVDEFMALSGTRGTKDPASGWLVLPQGEHILLAACRADEEAQESIFGEKVYGILSHFLMDTLQHTELQLTYRDLFKRVNALVKNRVALQSPQIEATDHALLDQYVLEGSISEHTPYFTLSYSRVDGWIIDGGAVHGIPPVADSETTTLALFPLASTSEQLRDPSCSVGYAQVSGVRANLSTVEVNPHNGQLSQNLTYKAIVVALPTSPLNVQITGEEPGVALAQ